MDQRRFLPLLGHLDDGTDVGAREQRRGRLVAALDQRGDSPLAVGGKVDVGRVDDGGGVGIARRRLRAERRLRLQRFDRSWERSDGGLVERSFFGFLRVCGGGGEFVAALAFLRRHVGEVERDLGVGDRGAIALEDPERIAVLALVEDPGGGRDDQFGRRIGHFQDLGEGLALGAGEVALRRRRPAFGRGRGGAGAVI